MAWLLFTICNLDPSVKVPQLSWKTVEYLNELRWVYFRCWWKIMKMALIMAFCTSIAIICNDDKVLKHIGGNWWHLCYQGIQVHKDSLALWKALVLLHSTEYRWSVSVFPVWFIGILCIVCVINSFSPTNLSNIISMHLEQLLLDLFSQVFSCWFCWNH